MRRLTDRKFSSFRFLSDFRVFKRAAINVEKHRFFKVCERTDNASSSSVHVKNIPEIKLPNFGTQTYNISAVSDVYF